MSTNNFSIKHIKAREILDSRGFPTIEVDVFLESGIMGRASVPSGASTGAHEAIELRDGDKSRFLGKGVLHAISMVKNVCTPALIGRNVQDQEGIDTTLINLDGTSNKEKIGANAILALSLACAKAAAAEVNIPLYMYLGGLYATCLPTPFLNVLNGGKHADNLLDIQEFMIVPIGAPSFREALRTGTEIYHVLKVLLKEKGKSTNIGDEGGFAPLLSTPEECIDILLQAIERAGYSPGKDIMLALDVAASELYNQKQDNYYFEGLNKFFSPEELIEYYERLVSSYPILSIEDGLAEDDWKGWSLLTQKLGSAIQLVGDDLFVTNFSRLREGTIHHLANSILIKPNQIGTLTETYKTIALARQSGYTTIMSHRSGETEDTIIADLAVAFSCGQLKAGAPCRMDRVAKYNQLLRIEETLGSKAVYAGKRPFTKWISSHSSF